jgi:hypothetical protein
MNAKVEMVGWTIDTIKRELEAMSSELSGQESELGGTSIRELGHFVSRLKGDIKYVTSEFSRLKGNIEAALAAPPDHDAVEIEHHGQFGKVTMNIHYTLGNGVAGMLGDHVEAAVFRAYREASAMVVNREATLEVNFRRTGLLVDMRYDREENLCFLHLELCRTQKDIRNYEFMMGSEEHCEF